MSEKYRRCRGHLKYIAGLLTDLKQDEDSGALMGTIYRLDDLEAARDRYKKALEEIAKGPDYASRCGECRDSAAMELMEIAEQALKQAGDE